MLRLTLVRILAIHHFRLEGSVFLKEDAVSPVFGFFKRKGENLRFHLSILFIVKLWFGRHGFGPVGNG